MTKRNITIVILLITIFIILPIVLFLLSNKALTESKVVVIDNSSDYSKIYLVALSLTLGVSCIILSIILTKKYIMGPLKKVLIVILHPPGFLDL